MPIEAYSHASPTASVLARASLGLPQETGKAVAAIPRELAAGQHSLASSVHAGQLQQAIVGLVWRLYLESRVNAEARAPRAARLFPVLVNASPYPPVDTFGEPDAYDPRSARVGSRLWRAFEAEPVEDGMDHPAEDVIRDALEVGCGSFA